MLVLKLHNKKIFKVPKFAMLLTAMGKIKYLFNYMNASNQACNKDLANIKANAAKCSR